MKFKRLTSISVEDLFTPELSIMSAARYLQCVTILKQRSVLLISAGKDILLQSYTLISIVYLLFVLSLYKINTLLYFEHRCYQMRL